MSNGLSILGIALTIIFIISLFALLAQLFYVLRRRSSLLRRIPTTTVQESSSKEQLLYLFCLRTSHLSRVEPSGLSSGSSIDPETEMEVIDMLKLESMYGPSKPLCSIKEGEREGLESADERSEGKQKNLEDEDEDDQLETSVPNTSPCASPLFLTPSASLTEEDFKSLPL